MKILIADAQALFRNGLRLVLAELDDAIEAVEAGSFPDALARAEDSAPFELVLLDLSLPGMAPFDGLRALGRRLPEASIVVLSTSQDRDDICRAVACGARGYVLKSSRPEALLHILTLALAGEVYVPALALRDAPSPRPVDGASRGAAGALAKLTPRERDVLAELVEGQSNKEIAHQLAIDEGTVKVHLKAVLRKLEVANRTQAAVAAVRSGWPPAGG